VAPSAVFREGTVARLARSLSAGHAAIGPTQNGKLTELREEGWL
jgi:hypothetical protein